MCGKYSFFHENWREASEGDDGEGAVRASDDHAEDATGFIQHGCSHGTFTKRVPRDGGRRCGDELCRRARCADQHW